MPVAGRGGGSAIRLVEAGMLAGSAAFAAAALLAPRWSARVAGTSTRTVRLLGARDVAIGVLLVRPGGRVGLVARGLSDASDVVLMARRRPPLAAVAALSAAASLGAALAGRRTPPVPGEQTGPPVTGWGMSGRPGGLPSGTP